MPTGTPRLTTLGLLSLGQPLTSAWAATKRASEVESKHHNEMWKRFWSKMFKSRSLHKLASRFNLTPGIVGFDLHLLGDNDRQTDKVIAFLFPGVLHPPPGLREELIKCLRKHVERKKDELYFPEWKVTLNISSLQNGERIIISRPHLLFSLTDALNGCLRSTLLLYDGKATLWDVHGGHVGGLCDGLQIPRTIGEVKDVCSVLLHGNNGQLRYHRFQRPGCPSVREIPASYDGQDIGPWGFQRSRQSTYEELHLSRT